MGINTHAGFVRAPSKILVIFAKRGSSEAVRCFSRFCIISFNKIDEKSNGAIIAKLWLSSFSKNMQDDVAPTVESHGRANGAFLQRFDSFLTRNVLFPYDFSAPARLTANSRRFWEELSRIATSRQVGGICAASYRKLRLVNCREKQSATVSNRYRTTTT